MRKYFFSFLIFTLIAISFPGCGKTPCAIASLDYGLVGFSDAESQHIVLRKYQKNGNFTNKLDTFIVQAGFRRTNDTLELTSVTSNDLLLSMYDYEIYFQTAARLYRINDIVELQSEIKRSIFDLRKDVCINQITQLTINGQVQNVTWFNRFYLVK
jgi:hypothetical protein